MQPDKAAFGLTILSMGYTQIRLFSKSEEQFSMCTQKADLRTKWPSMDELYTQTVFASLQYQVQSINCRHSVDVVRLEMYTLWKSIFIRIVIELE